MKPNGQAELEIAVAAFRGLERVELLLDKKRRELRDAVGSVPRARMTEYIEMTEHIRLEYEAKREREGLV